jgi:hypothetical protein
MESIVSMLVLAVLLTGIGAMLQVAVSMTAVSTRNAGELQHNLANPVVLASYTGEEDIVTFTYAGIDATHTVAVFNQDGIIAFAPDGG